MKSNRFSLILSRIICVCLVGTLAAALPAGMVQEGKRVESNSYEGTILMVSDSTLMLQTAPDYDALLFRVAGDAQITRNGEKAAVAQLQNGDVAMLTAERSNGELLASKVVAWERY